MQPRQTGEGRMSGLFISYRRIDAGPWAGRLFDRLSNSFGKSQVFMDIEQNTRK